MRKLIGEVMHFGIIGVINTLMGLVMTMTFYNILHWNYWVASAASYTIGSIFSYFANKKITFKAEGSSRTYALRFACSIVVCYLLAYGMAKPLVRSVLSAYPQVVVENIAIIIGMGLFIVMNFFSQKFFVFRSKNTEEQQDVQNQEQINENR